MTEKYKYLFGPVPSRRLGRSLGIDLIPFKTCSYNCVYCQLGQTTHQTVEREEYVPSEEVLRELEQKLQENVEIDFLTFSGSGEPTLHSGIGRIISELKKITSLPIAVLTNGSLLFEKEVRKDLLKADVILPTLSSVNPESFQQIHRPHPGLQLEKIIQGMIALRKEFKGEIWLEVFLVQGINDTEEEMKALKKLIEKIAPEKIQLNTSVRIPAEEYSLTVPEDKMERLAELLGEKAEVISESSHLTSAYQKADEQEILNYLKRRPGTLQDICQGLGVHPDQALKYLNQLLEKGKISLRVWQNQKEYYLKK